MNKCFAIGIILLLTIVSFSPIINADGNTNPKTIGNVPITILEYKADETVEKTVFRMSPEQADSFHEEMRNTQDLDARLSIYKKYNLISQDITVDSLQVGMQEKAQRMGFTQDNLMFIKNRLLFSLHVHRNIFCSLYGETENYFPIIIPFFRLFLLFSFEVSLIPSFINFIIGGIPVHLKGMLGDYYCYADILIMVGFVGVMYYYTIKIPIFGFDGFCVYTSTIGEDI